MPWLQIVEHLVEAISHCSFYESKYVYSAMCCEQTRVT